MQKQRQTFTTHTYKRNKKHSMQQTKPIWKAKTIPLQTMGKCQTHTQNKNPKRNVTIEYRGHTQKPKR